MNDWKQITLALLKLYLTVGIMAIGFGVMFAGKHGASRVAHVYFAGSLSWTLAHVRALITALLATVWHAFLGIVRTVAQNLWRGLHWLVTRKPGWLLPHPAGRSSPPRERRSWPSIAPLVARIKEFVRLHLNVQSLPFLLFLFCAVVAAFVIFLLLLRQVLE